MRKVLQKQLDRQLLGWPGDPREIATIDEFVNYVHHMQRFLNDEIDEVLAEVDPTRAARKPWHPQHGEVASQRLKITAELQQEAVDMLCFAMNICLACGVEPENVEAIYNEVHEKCMKRLGTGS